MLKVKKALNLTNKMLMSLFLLHNYPKCNSIRFMVQLYEDRKNKICSIKIKTVVNKIYNRSIDILSEKLLSITYTYH